MTSRAGAGGYGGSQGRRSHRYHAFAAPELRVTTARESSELDERSIAGGIPSRALMQRAGAAAAGEIARLVGDSPVESVVVYVGSGNNGGDGWVVARALAAAGMRVEVVTVGETRTADARAERELAEAEPLVSVRSLDDGERAATAGAAAGGAVGAAAGATAGLPGIVVDALLGTGVKGAPREPTATAIARIARLREQGATIVSLDIPSGVDADTGSSDGAVRADVTLTFGTLKRGLLVARAATGRLVLLDIGLVRAAERDASCGMSASGATYPLLVDGRWLRSVIPPFAAAAHKGTRKKLVIVGGQPGMAGAPVLAARAAMRSGIGMVRLVVAPASLPVVQGSEPHALAREWPGGGESDWEDVVGGWADVVLVGPGLGASSETRAMVERLLHSWRGPVVLDADALNVFAGDAKALGALLAGRPALLTPHAMEFARLSGLELSEVLDRRFDVGVELARTTGAAVLLKGVPTVVTAPDGARLVSASGTPALAAAGSGDLLGGIAATLLAQMGDALHTGVAAAWVHGRAAEIAQWGIGRRGARRARSVRSETGGARGITLADIEDAIAEVWRDDVPPFTYPVLAELSAVGEE
ncbi:MAG TPA: NAD(P)H-hydrate dehydratase [Gemmatimonadaceae bacterium]|nr:NAD(P)H-hydrate dehydratase [Gemmatimonadaceae bacterium]